MYLNAWLGVLNTDTWHIPYCQFLRTVSKKRKSLKENTENCKKTCVYWCYVWVLSSCHTSSQFTAASLSLSRVMSLLERAPRWRSARMWPTSILSYCSHSRHCVELVATSLIVGTTTTTKFRVWTLRPSPSINAELRECLVFLWPVLEGLVSCDFSPHLIVAGHLFACLVSGGEFLAKHMNKTVVYHKQNCNTYELLQN